MILWYEQTVEILFGRHHRNQIVQNGELWRAPIADERFVEIIDDLLTQYRQRMMFLQVNVTSDVRLNFRRNIRPFIHVVRTID